MTLFVTYASMHPAIADDRAFFAANPHRRYRARAFRSDEIGLPVNIAVFASDERSETGEINLVILQRIRGGRIRYHFAAFAAASLKTDMQIKAFLRSRGIVPFRQDRMGKRA